MTGIRSLAIRRGLLWGAAVVVWACSTATEVDQTGTDSVATVVVSPSTTTVSIGAQIPLQASVKDAEGKVVPGVPVQWTVQDSKIATVSTSGVVTGVAVGTTQVAANANGKSGIAAITVQKTPVASVTVRPSRIDAVPGVKTALTGIAYDAAQNTLSDRTIVWTTSNSGVATVDAEGMVTAVGPGSATITGTVEGKSDISTVTVTQAPVATVAIVPNPLSMSVSQSTQLSAVARDANGAVLTGRPVTWTSSNTAVATVSATGMLNAVAEGNTTITATTEGKSGTAAVTISKFAVGSVSVQPSTNTVVQNASVQLTAVVRDVAGTLAPDRVVAWSSSNTAVATVSASGIVTGVTPGNVTITATSEGQSGTAAVNVLIAPVSSVTVTPGSATVPIGQTTTLTATTKDALGNTLTGRAVTWTSGNTSVATVSSSGVVTAVAVGSSVITATSEGKTGTATITVPPLAVGSVVVAPAAPALIVGQTTTLSATVKNVQGTVVTDRVVTWETSNANVATVSTVGTVTAVGAGTATITATSEGKSGSSVATVTLPPVATVTFGSPTASVIIGQTSTLSPILKDANGNVLTGRVVTWASSSTNIATVSSAGVVSGVALGSSTITATSEGKSGTITVTVIPVPVGTVTVTPPTANVIATQTVPLSVTVKDLNGTVVTNRPVAWTTSSSTIATVSSSGVVTGVAPGTATITATSEEKSGSSTITVAAIPVASVTLSPTNIPLLVAQTTTPSITVRDALGTIVTNRVVTWGSSNSAIASVSSAGLITGVAAGTATITATSEGKSGSTTVVVTVAPVNSVTIAPTSANVVIGQTTTLAATVKDANGTVLTDRPVAWNSANPTVATVSATGVVSGVAVGTATITASAEGKNALATVTVLPVPVATVTVSPPTLTLTTIQTGTLSATTKDANGNVLTGRAVSWSSSNPLVATVSQSGLVTALIPGSTTITATSEGQSGTSTVTVNLVPVSTVTVTPSPSSAFIGGTTQLSATPKDALGNTLTGRTITWGSSNTNVATVSQTGLVTGVAAGSATITATSETKSGTSTVTVTQAPVATVTVSPSSSIIAENGTVTLTATLKDANGNVLTGRTITWSSTNNNTATVTQTGVVTGQKQGTVTIRATSEGQTGSATVTVTK
jgi:uncharacterized protein YjdB